MLSGLKYPLHHPQPWLNLQILEGFVSVLFSLFSNTAITMHARVLILKCGNKMFLCIKHVLEVGAELGLPVPVGSPSPTVSSRGCGATACRRGRRRPHGLAVGMAVLPEHRPGPRASSLFLSEGLREPRWVRWCSNTRSVPGLVSQQRASGHRGPTPLALHFSA